MSPADLDKARAQRDSALAEQDGARQQLDKLARGVRREDIDEAQAALLAATAEVALAERGWRISPSSPPAAAGSTACPITSASASRSAPCWPPSRRTRRLTPGSMCPPPSPVTGSASRCGCRWTGGGALHRPAALDLERARLYPYYALNEQDRARLVYLAEIDLPAGRRSCRAACRCRPNPPRG